MELESSVSSLSSNQNFQSTETKDQDNVISETLDSSTTKLDSTEEINGQDNASSFESMAALKLQKVYRGHRTRRKLADTAVVAEELWWQAIDYVRLSQSTVCFFDFKKPETAASRWTRVSLNASKVGKGLSKDTKALTLSFQHWIEAIDPRHRYGHSLHYYYDEWRKTDSGQPFFYWLDVGDGREVDLEVYPRSKLREECINYLGPQEREHYEYIVLEGKVMHKQTGELLDTSEGDKKAKWIYVMSTSKKLYIGVKIRGKFHHSSFLAGGTTLAAGRLVCEKGVLKSISAYSGHYRPTGENLDSFLAILEENGVNLAKIQIHHSKESENYEDSISVQEENAQGVLAGSRFSSLDIPHELFEDQLSEPIVVAQTERCNKYQRTLSGGIQSPRAEVPKNEILRRINTKNAASSYQLGHQVSFKWSTGAGARIGCVADYPMELRVQALELVNLSPKTPPTPTSFQQFAGYVPSTPNPTSDTVLVV
ncbi:hypothetical protein AQUCO_02700440v1 [Aquilegia coerulea]|uniref:IQ domain-containing protein IQM3-like n=1 Tax=Aquilegia coerulea TaxID=218851 RepID=A0A2G5D6W5_AQUCA|nr:hypothetical protein AQUCO_02700440v1 [Aquilegia coerulea]